MAQPDGGVDEVDDDVAAAVGYVALTDASVAQAADAVGVTTWKVEDAIEEAGLGEDLGVDGDRDVAAEIDDLLEDGA